MSAARREVSGSHDVRATGTKVISCAECRRLKIKCNLKFPCSHCTKRGLESICPNGELKEGLKGQRILAGTETLHRRIVALEEALRLATSGQHPLLETPLNPVPSGSSSTVVATQSVSAITPEEGDAKDRLSSYSHLVVGEEPGRSHYYGAASSVYLARRSRLNTTATEPHSPPLPTLFDLPSPSSTPRSGDAQVRSFDILIKYLPSIEEAHELVDIYYKSFGWFTNIVPAESFYTKHLYPLYESPEIASAQTLTLVFLILALGAVMDPGPQACKDQLVHSFIHAARSALALDSAHSVTLVQICYLYVTFVMNGRKDTTGGEIGWPYLRAGMAIAEALGLHRDPAQWDLPEEEATERRIVFWEIHGYDVLQSIALGRGQCIADQAIDCDYPDDGDETDFHRKAYALTRIWSRINERQIKISPSSYACVIDIDEALNRYEQSLPPQLSPGIQPSLLDLTDPSRKRIAFRRNMILMYLTEARMALHRGWFVRALKEYPLEPLASPQSRSFVNCLESCRYLISLVRSMLALHDHQINKRWHFFFHLFSACACLAACAIRAPTSSISHAVLAELDSGVGLFRMAGRDETDQLQRLADLGREAIRFGGTQGSHESEDLDLLSSRRTLRRAASVASSPQGSVEPGCPQEASFDSRVRPWAGTKDQPSLELTLSDLYERDDAGDSYGSHYPASMPTSDNEPGINIGAAISSGARGTLQDFDFDNFLEEMGFT